MQGSCLTGFLNFKRKFNSVIHFDNSPINASLYFTIILSPTIPKLHKSRTNWDLYENTIRDKISLKNPLNFQSKQRSNRNTGNQKANSQET